MFAIVEHQQQPPTREVFFDEMAGWTVTAIDYSQWSGNGVCQHRWVAHLTEFDEPNRILECALHGGGGPQRQSGLAYAADAGECHEPGDLKLLLDLAEFTAPTDETGQLGRQTTNCTACLRAHTLMMQGALYRLTCSNGTNFVVRTCRTAGREQSISSLRQACDNRKQVPIPVGSPVPERPVGSSLGMTQTVSPLIPVTARGW
jgi:hypothetical protein